MRRFVLAATVARLALANAVPEDPPLGIGTGVTAAIPPPGGNPPGCYASWSGDVFGIAAVNVTSNRRDVAVEGNLAFMSLGDESVESPTAEAVAAFAETTPAPLPAEVGEKQDAPAGEEAIVGGEGLGSGELPINKLVNGAAMAESTETDTTITVRSTRTHTRTVTLNRESSAAPSAPAAPTSATAPTSAAQPPPPPPAASQGTSGQFDLAAIAVGRKTPSSLILTLKDGVLKDALNRIGYIASNRQFQFDGPPQSGAIYTAGFSLCSNGTLALGPTTIFYQCRSGDFYNLYDQNVARQCNPVYLQALAFLK